MRRPHDAVQGPRGHSLGVGPHPVRPCPAAAGHFCGVLGPVRPRGGSGCARSASLAGGRPPLARRPRPLSASPGRLEAATGAMSAPGSACRRGPRPSRRSLFPPVRPACGRVPPGPRSALCPLPPPRGGAGSALRRASPLPAALGPPFAPLRAASPPPLLPPGGSGRAPPALSAPAPRRGA